MTGAWPRILAKYGQKVTVYKENAEEGTACRAFLQPLLERRGEGYQTLPTPLGLVRQDQWLYLGSPEVSLDGLGDGYVTWGTQCFSIRAAQPVYVGEKLAYWWGLLTVREQKA